MFNDSPPADASSLHGLCGGAVLLPGDRSYDNARAAWNLAVDQHPAAIAYPADAAETAEVVRAAAAAGLRVAPQGTGHNAGPLGALGDAVLLRTSAMIGTAVDPVTGRARVRAGVRWLDVTEAAADHGLAALHGSSPSVGVVGYSLGGGLGWYARALGQQSDSVTAVELVTADGQLVRADAAHEPELFWALRGGGGNFGVVTALEFALHPIRTVSAGALRWDWRHTGPVLRRWARWAAEAPDGVTSSLRLLPASATERRTVAVDAVVLGDVDRAAKVLAPLRELGPEVDTFAAATPRAVALMQLYPRDPSAIVADSAVLGGLPDAALDALQEAASPESGSSQVMVELRQLGGALGRPRPDAGASELADGAFLVVASTIASRLVPQEQSVGACTRVLAALAPYANGRHCLNFATRAVDARTGFPAESWQRLRAVRAAVDPGGLFLANHPLP
ncbi:oxidoreductase [Catellatospora sp. TT07R-123]|uniref:FAD-binding oxidoreductase n=1 Tax=Catellatospora sp. TT07R-123 TaxID=2733863 RepID=UPI001B10BE95|nr:FAD-binding oxidoreductase [Catellatospora sp. TT07R-123]GHJ47659.1 oxidoreductase [Catellatospora sp. TT07R-123]